MYVNENKAFWDPRQVVDEEEIRSQQYVKLICWAGTWRTRITHHSVYAILNSLLGAEMCRA